MGSLLSFVQYQECDNWSVSHLLTNQFDYNQNYKLVKISTFLIRDKTQIVLEDDVEYKRVTIKLYNKGVLLRNKAFGRDIGTKKQFIIKEGQFLLSKIDARNGAFGLATKDVDGAIITGDFFSYNFDKEKIDPQFLVLIATTKQFQKFAQSASSGTTGRQRIDEQKFLNVRIPLPPLDIQQKIVKDYLNKIELAKQKTQQVEQQEREIENYLYQELGIEVPQEKAKNHDLLQFVNFKNFHVWGYSHNIEKFKFHSHYQMVHLNSICEINRGGSPRPISAFITNNEDGINWIKIGDTKNIDKYIYKTKEKIKPQGIKNSRLVKDGDFILSNSMSFGKPYIMRSTGCIHDGWLLLRLNKKIITEDYLYHILNSEFMFKIFQGNASGAVVQNLNIEIVKNIKIPLPPLKVQQKVANHIQTIENKIQTLSQEAKRNQKSALSEFEAEIFA